MYGRVVSTEDEKDWCESMKYIDYELGKEDKPESCVDCMAYIYGER